MKNIYTISEYIESPLSICDLKKFHERERTANRIAWCFCLFAGALPLYFAPFELKIMAVFSGGLGFFVSLMITDQMERFKGLGFSDCYVVTAGYTEPKELYEHHLNLNIPDVVKLKEKIKSLGRSTIKLERDIIQKIYVSELSKKELELQLRSSKQ